MKEAAERWLAMGLAPADRAILPRTEVSRVLRGSLGESSRRGLIDNTDKLRLLVRQWGFRPIRIATPVRLWQGEADVTVPAAMVATGLAPVLLRRRLLTGRRPILPADNHADSILATLKRKGSHDGR